MSDEERFGTGKKKLSIYITGMFLCVILTLIPFAIVDKHLLGPEAAFAVMLVAAIVQFVVQVICFLRLNTSTPQSMMNLMSLIFTIVVLFVLVAGSLWIMWSLHENMMMMPHMHMPSSVPQ
jgi:cytochrome o ubiquinol oxidase operon protein cyoD